MSQMCDIFLDNVMTASKDMETGTAINGYPGKEVK